MKLQSLSRAPRRGSALLMAVMVLMVVTAIAAQLFIGTHTDARVARNDVALTTMDLVIESAMLEVFETLALDGEEAAASGAGAGAGDPGGIPGGGAAPGGGGEQQPASDSREDEWGRVQRTEINGMELRILVQDEDSKLNVLGMLTENEDEAELHFERLVRALDFCREGTSEDIDASDARRLVEAMRTHLTERSTSVTPMPDLATHDDENPDMGLPISLKEFEVLDPFNEGMFRDYRGEHGSVVHSIGSFLTVWTALEAGSAEEGSEEAGAGGSGSGAGSGEEAGEPSGLPNESELGPETEVSGAPGQGRGGEPAASAGGGGGGSSVGGGGGGSEGGAGGGAGGGGAGAASGGAFGVAVNVNTAPAAVLKALIDDRDVPGRWWDRVIEYRNLEEELEDGEEQPEPTYDEYGNEIIVRRFFDGLEELEEVPGTTELLTAERARINQLLTTQSQVFSIFITARKATGQQREFGGYRGSRRDEDEKEDLKGNTLTRTVRAVVWRATVGEEVVIVPLIRWEVLDYTPFEVEDYPDEDR